MCDMHGVCLRLMYTLRNDHPGGAGGGRAGTSVGLHSHKCGRVGPAPETACTRRCLVPCHRRTLPGGRQSNHTHTPREERENNTPTRGARIVEGNGRARQRGTERGGDRERKGKTETRGERRLPNQPAQLRRSQQGQRQQRQLTPLLQQLLHALPCRVGPAGGCLC